MNTLFLFIFIIISFFVPILNYEPSDTLFSLLLGKVRKDVVKSSMTNLPERMSVDILQMLVSMSKEKERSNLTDIEGVFLIYMWIGENIKTDCINRYKENESAVNVYNSGKGGVTGISSLFNIMCDHMNIQAGSISGFTKIKSYSTSLKYIETEHMWNFILIDNTKYLIDSSLGAGFCTDYEFAKTYTNLYFGTKPEILIKMNFPKNEEFQLVNKNITKYEWQKIVFRDRYFYLYGLINIDPEDKNFFLKNIDKITIEYDISNSDISIIGQMYYSDSYGAELIFDQVTYKKGIAEISLANWKKIYNSPIRFEIYVGKKSSPWEKLSVVFFPQSW